MGTKDTKPCGFSNKITLLIGLLFIFQLPVVKGILSQVLDSPSYTNNQAKQSPTQPRCLRGAQVASTTMSGCKEVNDTQPSEFRLLLKRVMYHVDGT